MLNGFKEFGSISLAHDLIHLRGLHTGIDQLFERLAGLYALVLPCVSDEQDAVPGLQLGKEVPHLFRACETGFLDHVQVPLRSVLTDTRE